MSFIIVGIPRSGTRMLSSALNSHSKIECWNEIFREDIHTKKQMLGHPDSPFVKKTDEFKIYSTLLGDGSDKGLVVHFWDGLNTDCGKYQLTDDLNPWPFLCGDRNLKVIHIKRENLFRRYISHVLANGGEQSDRENSEWHWLKNQNKPKDRKVYITRELAIKNINKAYEKHTAIDIIFGYHNRIDISYEELCIAPQFHYAIIQGFLEIKHEELICNTNKIIDDYSKVVINWDEVKDLDNV